MADDEARDDGLDPADELADEDLGEPIAELRDYAEAPSPAFLSRVLGSVRRRSLTSHLATLGWSALGQVLLSFLEMIYSLFASGEPERRE